MPSEDTLVRIYAYIPTPNMHYLHQLIRIEADGHHYFTIQSKRGSKASLRCKVKECSVRGVLNMESDMITLKVRFDRFSYR